MFSLAPLVFVIFEIRCFNETHFSGIQKRISSSPNDMKLIVFSFIRISLAYTELKGIYEGFLFSYSKSHCYVPLKLWISVWASVLAFGPVPSLCFGLLGFYPAWRLSDPICKCTRFCNRRLKEFKDTLYCDFLCRFCFWVPLLQV